MPPRRFPFLPAAAAAAAGLAFLILLAFFYPTARRFFPICPSAPFFHIYCPGCGSTRAVWCLLHGDVVGSLRNNVMLLPILLTAGALLIRPELQKHYRWINAFVALLILYTILRNVPVYPFTLLRPAGI